MKTLFVVLAAVAAAGAAQANTLQAGQWRVTTTPMAGSVASPPQVKMRCLTPDEVADPGKTFSPQVSTVNSECDRTEFKLDASGLKWRLQCKGQLDMDIGAEFQFESATRYTAIVTTMASMMGRVVQSSTAAIEGERIGECP